MGRKQILYGMRMMRVNSISMFGPTTGANGPDPIVEYDPEELLITGQWYWTKINQMDHWSVIGHFGSEEKNYLDIA